MLAEQASTNSAGSISLSIAMSIYPPMASQRSPVGDARKSSSKFDGPGKEL